MSVQNFVHLHNHTEYSMLDGAARVDELCCAAANLGMPAIATTDHGNMFSAYEFYKTANHYGIKPIIGTEAYVAPTSRFDKKKVHWGKDNLQGEDVSASGAYTHMTLLAATTEGMHNLFKLSSYSWLEGYYFKPRMDRELLAKFAKGVIATTGCPSGEVQTRLRLGQKDKARKACAELVDIFGREHLFVEIMDHGIEIEKRVRQDLCDLADEFGLKLLATNDLHYVKKEDAHYHEALLCVQTAATLFDPGRFRFDGQGYYLKTAEQMRYLFRDLPDACNNTLLVAEMCNVKFAEDRDYMPRFQTPDGETEESWLQKQVQEGLRLRFPNGVPDHVKERAGYEVSVICNMGFAGYFLIVADYVRFAKERGIMVGPGRGSGAGSMCSYALRITDLDPIEHGLIFERFLNPERVSKPDFDIDFDVRRRDEVIAYVMQKYGRDKVAHVITYSTIKSKQALKDAGRVLQIPYEEVEKITEAMPAAIRGQEISLSAIYDPRHPRYVEASPVRDVIENFKNNYLLNKGVNDTEGENQPDEVDRSKIYEIALGLENLKRQWSVHAAGVIMSSTPLIDIIPILKRQTDGQMITQFDYPSCEALGLIKMDFLGLRNLTVISDALENIKENRGFEVNLESLSLDDRDTYEMLSRGETLGVFQLDSPGLTSLLKKMKPDRFADISASIALYRPGPLDMGSHNKYVARKHKKSKIEPVHPELADALSSILKETYGLIIYQEQVIAIARELAGFSAGEADLLRYAMGKKKRRELDEQNALFVEGMQKNGFSLASITALWDVLIPFSDYAFNKAHSAGYAMISYWTAYLKCHFKYEYMAALLTSVADNKTKLAEYIAEARRRGISVLPPDINSSGHRFGAIKTDVRFGLGDVRNVGDGVVDKILNIRKQEDNFVSFADFASRVPAEVLNKRTIESLIKAGAFDSLGDTRNALFASYENVISNALFVKKNEAAGQIDLFAGLEDSAFADTSAISPLPEWDKREKLAYERETLGLYVSDHPLRECESKLGRINAIPVANLRDSRLNEEVLILGVLTVVERRIARQTGKEFAVCILEDLTGEVDLVLFGAQFKLYQNILIQDASVYVRGKLRSRDESRAVVVSEMRDLYALNIRIDDRAILDEREKDLAAIVAKYPGKYPVHIHFDSIGGYETPDEVQVRVFELDEKYDQSSENSGGSASGNRAGTNGSRAGANKHPQKIVTVDKSRELASEIIELFGPHCINMEEMELF